jgi:virginiamycin B lyase
MRIWLLTGALILTALLAGGVAAAETVLPGDPLGPSGAAAAPARAAQVDVGMATAPMRPGAVAAVLTEYTSVVSPTKLLQAPNGSIWFTSFYSSTLGNLDPAASTVRIYQLRQELNQRVVGVERDAAGDIWYSTVRAPAGNEAVGKLNPVTGLAQEWQLPAKFWNHYSLRVDPKTQDIWFLSKGALNNNLARLSPKSNKIESWSLAPYTDTSDLDLAPNGDVWFTVQFRGPQGLGRLKPATGQTTVWQMPVSTSKPYQLQVLSDTEIWLTEFDASGNTVSRFTPSTAKLEQYTLPTPNSNPASLTKIDGNIWFTEYRGNRVSALDPLAATPKVTTLQATSITAPAVTDTVLPVNFTPGVRKAASSSKQATLAASVSGGFTQFALPQPGSYPLGIAAASDGAVWLAESEAPRLALLRLTSVRALYLPLVERP